MNVYDELLRWANGRPLWQQEAVRRVFKRGTLEADDITELTAFCLAEVVALPQQLSPLVEQELPVAQSSLDHISLNGVLNTSAVNAMVEGTGVSFSPLGLTLVFGKTGSGKSGYTRVIKRVSRTRGAEEPVLPNAFGNDQNTPSADIVYSAAGNETILSWSEGSDTPGELSRVNVFDAHCILPYVDMDNEVAYLPEGLDVLPELSRILDAVSVKLGGDIARLSEASRSFPTLTSGEYADTAVAKAVQSMGKAGSAQQLTSLADMRKEDEEKRTAMGEALKRSDPKVASAQYRANANLCRQLAIRVALLRATLSDESLAKFESITSAGRGAASKARVERDGLKNEPLPDTGSALWQSLWRAAKEYASHAHPDQPFPWLGAEGRCELCQREHDSESRDRMTRLQSYFEGVNLATARRHHQEANEALIKARALPLIQSEDDSAQGQLNLIRSGLGDLLENFLKVAHDRVEQMEANFNKAVPLAKPLPEWPDLTSGMLSSLGNDQTAKALETDKLTDEAKRKAMIIEHKELEARHLLGLELKDVLAENQRRIQLSTYSKAQKSCNTRSVTAKQKELSDATVGPQLQQAFGRELASLGALDIKVELQPVRGQKGTTYHRIKLTGVEGAHKVSRVLSEAQRRMVALAACFTDLALSPDRSTLVFDDPVSSLDHDYRKQVAKRLIEESSHRQVVVFTHDLSFVCHLYEAAAKDEDITYRELVATGQGSGISYDDLPNIGASVKDRIKVLNIKLQEKRPLHNSDPREWTDAASTLASKLRSAWERAIEEVLFGAVVTRFDPAIHTQQLRRVVFETHDIDEVDRAMTQLSQWTEAHDDAAALIASVPTPDELEAEIRALSSWVKDLRAAQEGKPRPSTVVK